MHSRRSSAKTACAPHQDLALTTGLPPPIASFVLYAPSASAAGPYTRHTDFAVAAASVREVHQETPLHEAMISALRGGLAGAGSMAVSVCALMWLRTTVNYQYRRGRAASRLPKLHGSKRVASALFPNSRAHRFNFLPRTRRYGTNLPTALRALYNDGGRGVGGVVRFYRGVLPALLQARRGGPTRARPPPRFTAEPRPDSTAALRCAAPLGRMKPPPPLSDSSTLCAPPCALLPPH